MTKMLILMELMVCTKRIELSWYYYVIRMGQMCEVQKWIYFGFIAIYIGFMAKTRFLL